jgi:hypothetical protein
MDILYVNMETKIIYHSGGSIILQDTDKFNNLILQEKQKISRRDYILNRFEPWEVDSIKALRMLLLSRSRNEEEKKLVTRYVAHLTGE